MMEWLSASIANIEGIAGKFEIVSNFLVLFLILILVCLFHFFCFFQSFFDLNQTKNCFGKENMRKRYQ